MIEKINMVGKKEIKILILFFVALGSILVYKWWNSGQVGPSQRESKSVLIEAEKAKIGTITRRITMNGSLVAHQLVVLKAEVEGKVKEISFKQGQAVKKNDLLLKIDEDVYRLQVKEAEARVKLSKTEYDRSEYLLKKDFGTSAARDKALANLKVNEAELEVANLRLSQTEIRAPFDGTVGLKNVSVGSFIAKNEEILTIVDLNPIYVDFPVPESYGKLLVLGQEVDATIEGVSDLPVSGEIIAIDPKADFLTHSIQVRAELDNGNHALKPGQFARVNLELNKERGVLIPQIAVEREGNQEFVFIVQDGIAIRTEVTIGQKENGMVCILDGVKESDWVVTVGQIKIQDGMPVRIKNAPSENPKGLKK
ncbi:MAG: efflux RND transporter periplasmic adaptor subunit [Alphaproteobacteria bacterium]